MNVLRAKGRRRTVQTERTDQTEHMNQTGQAEPAEQRSLVLRLLSVLLQWPRSSPTRSPALRHH